MGDGEGEAGEEGVCGDGGGYGDARGDGGVDGYECEDEAGDVEGVGAGETGGGRDGNGGDLTFGVENGQRSPRHSKGAKKGEVAKAYREMFWRIM